MNLSTKDLSALERATEPILKSVGRYILEKQNQIGNITFKDKRDIVTDIDIEAEKTLEFQLKKILPEAGFIKEESDSDIKEGVNWVIDPIDGTKNFIYRFPFYNTQIALLSGKDAIFGQLYNPTSSDFFSGSLGNGTRLNGISLTRKADIELSSSIIDIDFGGNDDQIDWKLSCAAALGKQAYRLRMMGGIGTVYMATGAIDASIDLNRSNNKKFVVDNAPKIIILRESGMKVNSEILKNGHEILLYAHPSIYSSIFNLLNSLSS